MKPGYVEPSLWNLCVKVDSLSEDPKNACWYAVRKGKSSHWSGGRQQTTVWDIAGFNIMGKSTKETKLGHGTQKPLECMARPIRNHEGDVYDPFVGVGTTIVAAEQEGRRSWSVEIDPDYVAVALQRCSDLGLKVKNVTK